MSYMIIVNTALKNQLLNYNHVYSQNRRLYGGNLVGIPSMDFILTMPMTYNSSTGTSLPFKNKLEGNIVNSRSTR